jgi:cysteinyl-tRNA synthetase
MTLPSLYNTLTRQQEPVAPSSDGTFGIYCCGPTVYDVPHAGHARAALAPDVLVRFLRAQGQKVTYVRNITDVDDKILDRSAKNGESPLVLSARMAEVYQGEMKAFGCVQPDHQPRVSEHIPQIIALVKDIIAHDAGYLVARPEGTTDVYFEVRRFTEYGKLSRRRIDELVVGARVAQDSAKHDPLDFALWKGTKPEEWGWDSPWGRGRPGWHIECSAMSRQYLGHSFAVHAGGMDLIFPHHENEIAQSEAAYPGEGPFARCWMHNGFVNIDKEKMSKSLGNFVTLGDVLSRNDAEGFRWFLLGVHYRGPVQFDTEKLEDGRVVFPGVDEAERRVDYLYAAWERLTALVATPTDGSIPTAQKGLGPLAEIAGSALARATQAMCDDLNTPSVLAVLGELLKTGNELCDLALKRRREPALVAAASHLAAQILNQIRSITDWLGLLQTDPQSYRERTRERRVRRRGLSVETIEAKVAERDDARVAKDFARSDALRAELTALGVTVKDTPTGAVWEMEV